MGPLIFRELKSCRKGHQIKGTAPVGVTSVCYLRDTIAAQSSSGGRVTPRGALGERPRSETPHFTRTTTAHNSHSNVKSFAVLIRSFSSLSKAQRTQPTSQPITNGAGRVSPELQWDPQKETLGGTWLSVGPPAAPRSSLLVLMVIHRRPPCSTSAILGTCASLRVIQRSDGLS